MILRRQNQHSPENWDSIWSPPSCYFNYPSCIFQCLSRVGEIKPKWYLPWYTLSHCFWQFNSWRSAHFWSWSKYWPFINSNADRYIFASFHGWIWSHWVSNAVWELFESLYTSKLLVESFSNHMRWWKQCHEISDVVVNKIPKNVLLITSPASTI